MLRTPPIQSEITPGHMELPPALSALDLHTRVTRGISQSAFGAFTQVLARSRLRTTCGPLQVWSPTPQWQLRHNWRELPPSLETLP